MATLRWWKKVYENDLDYIVTELKDAVERRKLASSMWRERDLYGLASTRLKRAEPELRRLLTSLGKDLAGSWRAEHKAAALAAWLVLADTKDSHAE